MRWHLIDLYIFHQIIVHCFRYIQHNCNITIPHELSKSCRISCNNYFGVVFWAAVIRERRLLWIAKCICINCKMYLSKVQHVFVQIVKVILCWFLGGGDQGEAAGVRPVAVQPPPRHPHTQSHHHQISWCCSNSKCICPNCKMYFSKLQDTNCCSASFEEPTHPISP